MTLWERIESTFLRQFLKKYFLPKSCHVSQIFNLFTNFQNRSQIHMVQNSISIKECTVKILQFTPPAIQFPCLETICIILIILCIYKQTHTHLLCPTFSTNCSILSTLFGTLLFQLTYLKVIPFSTFIVLHFMHTYSLIT